MGCNYLKPHHYNEVVLLKRWLLSVILKRLVGMPVDMPSVNRSVEMYNYSFTEPPSFDNIRSQSNTTARFHSSFSKSPSFNDVQSQSSTAARSHSSFTERPSFDDVRLRSNTAVLLDPTAVFPSRHPLMMSNHRVTLLLDPKAAYVSRHSLMMSNQTAARSYRSFSKSPSFNDGQSQSKIPQQLYQAAIF